MDIKRLISSVTVMLVLFMAWQLVITRLNKSHPEWNLVKPDATTQPADVANAPTTNPTTDQAFASTQPSTQPVVATTGGFTPAPAPPQPPQNIGSSTNADSSYVLGAAIDPIGAGLDSATLNNFWKKADRQNLYSFEEPLTDLESSTKPLATRTVTLDGASIDLSNVTWTRVAGDAGSATFATTILTAGKPVLEVRKQFNLPTKQAAGDSAGYEMGVVQSFRNLSGKPLSVSTSFAGPTLPPRENDRSEDRQFIAAYNDDGEAVVKQTSLSSLTGSSPTKDLKQEDGRPLLWVGAGSAYFNAIFRLDQPANAPVSIAAVPVYGVDLDAPSEDRLAAMSVETNTFVLQPATTAQLNLKVFLGPKKRELLKNPYYSSLLVGYDRTLVTSGGFCGFLTFQWLVNLLYGILWTFHFILRDWGLAIIGLVILVRSLLHPLTKRSQVKMMAMGKMGPELEKLKRKYADNKDELNKAMMSFYKEQGTGPLLGCLPMFLQTPIWIALWSALQSTFELRQAPFLQFGWLHLTWIKDLSHPDYLVQFSHPVQILFFTVRGINVLPLLMGGVFFLQQRFQPKPVNMSVEQEQQQKMMRVLMPLIFPIMLYAGPSGLNLYILTSTSIGIVESKIVRDHVKQKEEEGRAGRIIVEAKPTRAARRRDTMVPSKPAGPQGRIAKFIAELQEKAEEIRRNNPKL